MSGWRLAFVIAAFSSSPAVAAEPFQPDRCEVTPLADFQTSLAIDGEEHVRWHFGAQHPGPFFYPLRSPRGGVMTRMGHPGAPNHDHHRSVWFAHKDVDGLDFWSMGQDTQIRQKSWYGYVDGEQECVMATLLGWYDREGKEVMQQDLMAALRPLADEQHALEIQVTLRPGENRAAVDLGKTNFGLLAVRVAKTMSVHFGGGQLTNSEGAEGEAAIFGRPARWIDYSGPVVVGSGAERTADIEGLTFFDHPDNPRYPTAWHVRADGWMGAAFCLSEGYALEADRPLTLRYLLYAHSGEYDPAAAERLHKEFAARPGFEIHKSTQPHQQFDVVRSAAED